MSILRWFTRTPTKPESVVLTLRRMDARTLSALHPKWVVYYGKDSGQVRLVEKLIAQRKGFRGA